MFLLPISTPGPTPGLGRWGAGNQAVGQRDLRQRKLGDEQLDGRQKGGGHVAAPAAPFLSLQMLCFLTEISAPLLAGGETQPP